MKTRFHAFFYRESYKIQGKSLKIQKHLAQRENNELHNNENREDRQVFEKIGK